MWTAITNALAAIPIIGKIVDAITGYFHDKGVKDAQRNSDQRDQAVAGLAEVDAAQRARDAAGDHQRADPDSVRRPAADTAPRRDGIS
jgi:hypothetical protein